MIMREIEENSGGPRIVSKERRCVNTFEASNSVNDGVMAIARHSLSLSLSFKHFSVYALLFTAGNGVMDHAPVCSTRFCPRSCS